MKSPTIIGIAGRMKSGKTALAQSLSEEYGWSIFSFAGSVRDEISKGWFSYLPKAEARVMWDLVESEDKSLCRPLLQAWGHGRRQITTPDYWVHKILKQIRDIESVIIIDDVRYPNEMQMILDNDGYIIYITTTDNTLIGRGVNPPELKHESECALPLNHHVFKHRPFRVHMIEGDGVSVYGLYKRAKQKIEGEWEIDKV